MVMILCASYTWKPTQLVQMNVYLLAKSLESLKDVAFLAACAINVDHLVQD